jgi:hypothetical protein
VLNSLIQYHEMEFNDKEQCGTVLKVKIGLEKADNDAK